MPRRTIIVIDARKSSERKKKRKNPRYRKTQAKVVPHRGNPDTDPDWSKTCSTCGQAPIVPVTGLCGPCTFGEAETAGGNW